MHITVRGMEMGLKHCLSGTLFFQTKPFDAVLLHAGLVAVLWIGILPVTKVIHHDAPSQFRAFPSSDSRSLATSHLVTSQVHLCRALMMSLKCQHGDGS